MKTDNNLKIRTSTADQHSYSSWGNKVQVIRKGSGEIAMTESELVSFFGVTWRKLSRGLQTIMMSFNLHPEERVADEEEVVINGLPEDYAPLYPLSIVTALSSLLDNTEAHLFRKYIYQKLQKPAPIITSTLLVGNMGN